MLFRQIISHLKNSPEDAWYYVQGTFRLYLYKRWWLRWLLRKSVIREYEYRRDVAANDCYMNGSCICCGCDTPAVFMADKGCPIGKYAHCSNMKPKPCYGPMK